MAIRITPSSSSLNTSNYLHGKEVFSTIKSSSLTPDFCSIDIPGTCLSHVPAFAYLSDEYDRYRNDIRSFIYVVPTGGTVTATLINNVTGTTYALNSSTYGDYFSTGTLKSGVWGFILRWYRVADVIGYGQFKVNIVIANSSATTVFDYTTPCFDLKPWRCDDVHGTVKISTWQSGYLQDGFDYRGIFWSEQVGTFKIKGHSSWPQELRWYGALRPTKPTYVNDTIQDSNRNEVQVQSQIVKNYTLTLDNIYECLTEPFLTDTFLSGEIYVSDYNTNAVSKYNMVRVNPLDITERANFPMTRNEFFRIDLEQFKKSTIKRY